MKTITVSEAEGRLGEIIEEVWGGQPIVVRRGHRRVLLRACASAAQEREWAAFCAAFPLVPPEPPGAAARLSSLIKRVRHKV